MLRLLFTYIFCIILATNALGQVTDRELDKNQYPANNKADSKYEAAFASYFEETNVSNSHIYMPPEGAEYDYYYQGKELPKGLFGIFNQKWRQNMPEDFKAYAVFSIRGEGKPYYILRFSGEKVDPSIGLFEMIGDKLHHKATLATYWCADDYCIQKDSWLQDFDGNVRLDFLTKVKMMDKRGKHEVIDEFYSIYKQLEDGKFVPDSRMDVDVNDYFMQKIIE